MNGENKPPPAATAGIQVGCDFARCRAPFGAHASTCRVAGPKHASPPARRPKAPAMPQPRRLVRRLMHRARMRGLRRKQSSWLVLQVALGVREDLDAMFYDHGATPSDLIRWLDYLIREATLAHDESKP